MAYHGPVRAKQAEGYGVVAFRLERDKSPTHDIRDGEILEAVGEESDWIIVKYGAHQGWIKKKNVEPVAAPEIQGTVIAQQADGFAGVAFRKEQRDNPNLPDVPNGTECSLLKTEGDWLQISHRQSSGGQLTGWVKERNVQHVRGVPAAEPTYTNAAWRTDENHPLHIPFAKFPMFPDQAYFDVKLPIMKFNAAGAVDDGNKITEAQIAETLAPFPLVVAGAGEWEAKVHSMFNKEMTKWPESLSKHGYSDDARWAIDSIRTICNPEHYDAFDAVPMEAGEEPILTFHGTQLAFFRLILQHNFKVEGPGGWYGNGGYFTTSLPYSQHYIGGIGPGRGKSTMYGFQLPKVGNIVYIFAALVKPGKCAIIDVDKTPDGCGYGYSDASKTPIPGTYRDKPKDPDPSIMSHHAYVAPPAPTNKYGIGFRPTSKESSACDEYVIFDRNRVVPRFIVGLQRTH